MSGRLERYFSNSRGSTELLVIGLISAILIVICLPLLSSVGENVEDNIGVLSDEMTSGEVSL